MASASSFSTQASARLGHDPKELDRFTKALVEALAGFAADPASVAIPGFGTFAPVKTPEHITTAADGRTMLNPPSVAMTFIPSVVLRKRLSHS